MSKYINEAIEILFRGFIFADLTEREKEMIYATAEALQLAQQRGYRDGYKTAKEEIEEDKGFRNGYKY